MGHAKPQAAGNSPLTTDNGPPPLLTQTTSPIVPDTNHRESFAGFRRWICAQLGVDATRQADISLAALVETIREHGLAIHARPREQGVTVNDIAQRLFAAYEVEGGKSHLGGCQLADFPFLRMSYLSPEDPAEVRHMFLRGDGSSVSDQLVRELGLLDLEPIGKSPPRMEQDALQSLLAAGNRVAAKASSSRDPQAVAADPLLCTVIWVKRVSGQLNFTIGEQSASLPFSDWVKTLVPKPYVAEHSGTVTFHLATTDDGKLDAAEAIAKCELTGQRRLRSELTPCSVTGKLVKREFTQPCPVSGRPTLTNQFTTCPVCRQAVSLTQVDELACLACRNLEKVNQADPRLSWILGEHPALERWSHWKLAETLQVYIAQGSRFTKRILVVVDKETLAIRHLAISGRFSQGWTAVEESGWGEWTVGGGP